MTEQEKVWQRFNALPPEAQRQVGDFIGFLHTRLASESSAEPPASSAEEGSFVGMWADRDDLADSRARMRALREREWASHR